MLVKIEKIVNGGYGIARIEGRTCLVPFSVPGDILDVECGEGQDAIFGWIKEIVRPSSYRRLSDCPVFMRCGGCDFDHMKYTLEIEVKKGILLEDLSRIAKAVDPEKLDLLFDREYGYRNHAQFKVDKHGNVGFFEKKSHAVVSLPEKGCLLLRMEINDYVARMIERVRKEISFPRGGFRVRVNEAGIISQKGIPGIPSDSHCYHSASGLRLRTNIDDFFQINSFLIGSWLNRIVNYLQPKSGDVVADVFCGSGIISLTIARKVRSVLGIELNKNAVINARYNARENGIENVRFVHLRADKGIGELSGGEKIVINPPRAGLSPGLIADITQLTPDVVVYASCDTATFSRDVKMFHERGYRLREVTLVDMFPRTTHIEVVSRLTPG